MFFAPARLTAWRAGSGGCFDAEVGVGTVILQGCRRLLGRTFLDAFDVTPAIFLQCQAARTNEEYQAIEQLPDIVRRNGAGRVAMKRQILPLHVQSPLA